MYVLHDRACLGNRDEALNMQIARHSRLSESGTNQCPARRHNLVSSIDELMTAIKLSSANKHPPPQSIINAVNMVSLRFSALALLSLRTLGAYAKASVSQWRPYPHT